MNEMNSELHLQAVELSKNYQSCEAKLLDVLIKIDQNKIYLSLGLPSLFQYCVDALKLSEAQSYSFMTVCRKSKDIPELKSEIQSGRLSLSKARRIVPVLTKENHQVWIEKAKNLPKAELEREVAKISPYSIKMKEQARAIGENHIRLKLEIDETIWKDIKRAQVLLMNKRRKSLDLEGTLKELVESFLIKNDPLRIQKFTRENSMSKENQSITPIERDRARGKQVTKRYLSRSLRREIFQRDQGKCSFKGINGKICGSQSFLEIHHIKPWSLGGTHDPQNLQSLCSAHHRLKHS